jgi:DNA-binding NarL/FixJ family response regulator
MRNNAQRRVSGVLLADSDAGVRASLKELLRSERFRVTGEASDGPEAVRLAAALRPQVVILDLSLPFLNGLQVARRIQKASPRTRVVLLSPHAEHPYVVAALGAHIDGYVVRTRAAARLLHAIRDVRRGRIHLCPDVITRVLRQWAAEFEVFPQRFPSLDREVLELMLHGKTDPEVSRSLGITAEDTASCRARILNRVAGYARSPKSTPSLVVE